MKVRKYLSVLLALVMLLCLTACGSSAKSEAAYDNGYYATEAHAPAEMQSVLSKSEETSSASLPTDRKLIRTITMEAETEDLTTLTDEITARVSALGGYVEAKNLRNGSSYSGYVRHTLSMTVRIPADQADAFVATVSEHSNIVSSTESVDDVTLKYVDTESHVKALEAEQASLLSLLEKADNLKDIITLQERLTSVRYELERYASQLRTMDNQVTYATIRLSITEVKEYTPIIEEEPTVWQRISTGFGRTIRNLKENAEDFFVWLVSNSPYLVIWGAVAAVVLLILRRRGILRPLRKKAKKPEDPTE